MYYQRQNSNPQSKAVGHGIGEFGMCIKGKGQAVRVGSATSRCRTASVTVQHQICKIP